MTAAEITRARRLTDEWLRRHPILTPNEAANAARDSQLLLDASLVGVAIIVETLLNAGADPNPRSLVGSTPLMLAASNGHADVAKTLIAAGADVHAKNQAGATALGIAKGAGHHEIVEVLRAAGAAE